MFSFYIYTNDKTDQTLISLVKATEICFESNLALHDLVLCEKKKNFEVLLKKEDRRSNETKNT